MATVKRFYVDINLTGREIQRASFERVETDPVDNLTVGRMIYNTTDDVIKYYDGTEWVVLSTGGDFSTISETLALVSTTLGDVSDLATENSEAIDSIVSLLGDADSDTIPSIIDKLDAVSEALTDASVTNLSGTLYDVSLSTTDNSTAIVELTSETSDISSSLVSLTDDTSESIASLATQISDLDVGSITTVISNVSDSLVELEETVDDISTSLTDHIDDTLNPHSTTLAQVVAAGNTAGGEIDMDGDKIVNVGEPTDAEDAANKAYVDAVAQGLKVRDKVAVAVFTNLDATYAEPGGTAEGATLTNTGTLEALEIDGYTLSLNQRVLVGGQSTEMHNGIYKVTTVGDASTPWVLTRSGEFDDVPDPELLAGDYFFVQFGTQYGATGWVVRAHNGADPVVGTDPVLFTQFSAAGAYTAGNGIDIDGTTISVDPFELVGTGLEVAADSETLQVVNYTPVTGATVARKVELESEAIVSDTLEVFTHNLDTRSVQVTVLDENENFEEVVVNWYSNNDDQITIESGVSFTARIIIVG